MYWKQHKNTLSKKADLIKIILDLHCEFQNVKCTFFSTWISQCKNEHAESKTEEKNSVVKKNAVLVSLYIEWFVFFYPLLSIDKKKCVFFFAFVLFCFVCWVLQIISFFQFIHQWMHLVEHKTNTSINHTFYCNFLNEENSLNIVRS